MALPAGVTTFELQFGKSYDFSGANLRTDLTITPSHEVRTATGDRVVDGVLTVAAVEGSYGSIFLPQPGQGNLFDLAGNLITNFWYEVHGTDSLTGRTVGQAKRWMLQPTLDQTFIDLDVLPTDGVVDPVGSAVPPAVTSVNGMTGAVTVAPLDGSSKVPVVNLPLQAIADSTELSATYGTVTITVSAADTPLPYRTRADYQCDGVGDIATIQAALDALPDDNASSGEVVLLPGNYVDATGQTLSVGSPSSISLNPRKVLRFHRGARLNVSGSTGRLAVIKIESPDCQVINPNVAGSSSFGNGTGIAIGGDVATFGGRWDRVCNRVLIENPILSNLETGIEFCSIDGGVGSTGDAIVNGGYIFQNKTGIRAAGYTNTVHGTTLANNNKAVWVESRRVEAQIRCYALTIVGWNEVGILVDGGFGSVFHDTWMEHTSATGSTATEAIRFGLSGTVRAHFTRFTGTTHVQLVNETYAVRYVGAIGTKIEDLVISTSGAVPSVAAVRNEAPSTSKRNRIERITYGPSSIPSNTVLSIEASSWGDVFIDRIPGATADIAFSTRPNPSTRASLAPTVRHAADTSKTSDTTLAAESDMTVNLSPSTNYALTGLIIFDASQAGDFKMSLTVSAANAAIQWGGFGPASSHVSAVGVSSVTTQRATSGFTMAWGGAGTGVPIMVPISGIVTTQDLSMLTMQWAQNTSDGTATILKAGSWLRLEPIA